MPNVRTFAVAGVSFAPVSRTQLLASSVKVLPSVVKIASSTNTLTTCPAVSVTHITSSDVLTEMRLAAARQVPTVTGTPGVAAGQLLATYSTRFEVTEGGVIGLK